MEDLLHRALELLRSLHSPEGIGQMIKAFGMTALILIVFAETGLLVGFFLPGDSLLVTAGIFAASDGAGGPPLFNVWLLASLVTLAAVVGDQVGYVLGRKSGPLIFSKEDSFFFKKKHVVSAHDFYEKHGGRALIIARFMPIFRTFVPFVAGVAQMDYRKFYQYNIVGGVLWVWSMVFLGYFLGKSSYADQIHKIVIVVVILSVLPIFIGVAKKLLSKKKVSGSEISLLVISFFLFTVSPSAWAKVRGDFRSSQTQAFLIFISEITQNRRESALKDLYLKSAFNTPKTQNLLESLDIFPWNEDSGFPDISHPAFQLLVQSAYSKNLGEFSGRAIGIFSPAKHKSIFSGLQDFFPLYNRLLWGSSQKFLESFQHSMSHSGNIKRLDSALQKNAAFLSSDWPDDINVSVNTYPLPENSSFEDNNYAWGATLGVPLNNKDVSQGLERSFAQMTQALLQSRKDDDRAEWSDYFLSLSSFPSSRFLRRRFPEILSFALARHWMGSFQQSKEASWLEARLGEHEAKYVDDLQELIDSYFSRDKKLDRAFVTDAVQLFEKNHKEALLRYSLVFERTLFWVSPEIPLDGSFWKVFSNYFPRGSFANSPSSEITSLVDQAEDAETLFYVLKKKDRPLLAKLAAQIPELKKEIKNFESGAGLKAWAFNDSKNRPVILVRAESLEEINEALREMKDQKFFDGKSIHQKGISSLKGTGAGG